MTIPRPLEGVRVLDFTWVLAGPYATRLLADFGAEVIKVQSHVIARGGTESTRGGYYNYWNRNKLSISLNMTTPEGIALAKRLVACSDIVMENFSARVMANWGLDYPHLREVRPDIIYISMAGMGQSGPWRDYTSFGPTLQALSGMTHLMTFPGLPPLGFTYSYADHVGGITAALAALLALEHRRRTGRGQHVDLAQFEAMTALMGTMVLELSALGRPPQPVGNRARSAPFAPHGVYRCRGEDPSTSLRTGPSTGPGHDRWVAIAVTSDEEWAALRKALGEPSWAEDPRFATAQGRWEHQDELDEYVERWTMEHTPEEVQELLQAAGVPAGVVASAEDLAQDPHLRERGFFATVPHLHLGSITLDRPPVRLSADLEAPFRPAPELGQDNHYVFGELLGLSREEIEDLERRQVVY